MYQLRCILAALFAILIANPACCCAAMRPVEKAKVEHSCCSKKKDKQEDAACDCATKSPRIAETNATVPTAPIFILPAPILSAPPMPELFEIPASFVAVSEPIDKGPPRLRLALLQSYLI